MCNPIVAAVVIGGATAIAANAEQNRAWENQATQVNYSNVAARQKWDSDLKITQLEDKKNAQAYELANEAAAESITAYYRQKDLNSESAKQASVSEQIKLSDEFAAAAFESEANLIKSIQGQGAISASGQQGGQSMALDLAQVEREMGFQQAQIDATLFSATKAFGLKQTGINLDLLSADTQARNRVNTGPAFAPENVLQPVKPLKMPYPKKPSPWTAILQGVSAGVSTFGALD